MDNKRVYLGLDVGGQRIGLATGDSIGRIAQPLTTIRSDDAVADHLGRIIRDNGISELVVGRPRNQSGHETNQTQQVQAFAGQVLRSLGLPVHWQDESVTSVIAEERLKARKKPYSRGDIDAEAASIILQDFLEQAL